MSMSKIVSALNVMILNSRKISNCVEGVTEGEYYFLYDGKYKWSIMANEGEYYLNYYPVDMDLNDLASLDEFRWMEVRRVTYMSSDIGGREAEDTFRELHSLVEQKLYNMDDVLEDIIQSDESED